jgi:hypothetical protein
VLKITPFRHDTEFFTNYDVSISNNLKTNSCRKCDVFETILYFIAKDKKKLEVNSKINNSISARK